MECRGNADLVRAHVPKGRGLPERFDAFLHANLPFRVEWNVLDAYGLKHSATKTAVPFLRLPVGGLVALWYHAAEPAVVHIGAHGEQDVIAADFDAFLKAVGTRCTGVPDIDEGEEGLAFPGVRGRPDGATLPALQGKFDKWFKRHTSLLEPTHSPDTEPLRKRVHEVAEAMIRDGRSRVYTLWSPWWSMTFRVERLGDGLSVTYLDYGEWYPVPSEYELTGAVAALLELVKNKGRGRYELSASSGGTVSIDRDRELVLVPPAGEAK